MRRGLVAGLARTVLVVEAAATSGALITARHAIDDHGRHPCAIPGPVDAADVQQAVNQPPATPP